MNKAMKKLDETIEKECAKAKKLSENYQARKLKPPHVVKSEDEDSPLCIFEYVWELFFIVLVFSLLGVLGGAYYKQEQMVEKYNLKVRDAN